MPEHADAAVLLNTFLSALFYGVAGMALFILTFSRLILRMEDGPLKTMVSWVALLLLGPVPFTIGYGVGFGAWSVLPAGVLVALLVGEIRLRRLQRRLRGSGPVETKNARPSIWRPFTTCDLALRRYEIRVPQAFPRRFRVAHISDLHVNTMLPEDYYRTALERTSRQNPDIVLITGDFVSLRKHVPLVPGILRHAHARLGVFAILGNHDWWVGAKEVSDAVTSAGVQLLGNGWRHVPLEGGKRLVLSGCEAPWAETAWELPPRTDRDILLVATHTADNIYTLSGAGATAVFSGHYHGGQAVFPLLGPLVIPSRLGRRFTEGHFVVNSTDLFVTTGVGVFSPPLRVYCKPEILIVDFLGPEEEAVPARLRPTPGACGTP